ncbi:hypothetical protein BU23DRAFT_168905 [Bimuria novae-zelandiae CBS 107.79]|uniref:Heterokaryon incompatibility domain-containing protein n=1 Tax=Bimuria novae-zelandiae CBS 107.79 TaxID=1447943 RepID=A0A6A5V7G9_9PLEO|nr:hypothetical protein BU23DRAFT_168905 [Bimuria novae-zelandiae CBS 107.79]
MKAFQRPLDDGGVLAAPEELLRFLPQSAPTADYGIRPDLFSAGHLFVTAFRSLPLPCPLDQMMSVNNQASSPPAWESRPKYQYLSLEGRDYIRVLVFDDVAGDDEVTFTLEHQPLSGADDFDALFYYWGSKLKTQRVNYDGAIMYITESLFSALKNLARLWKKQNSSLSPFGRLWVDAICINQEDDEEKSQQIPLMGTSIQQHGKQSRG